MQAMHKLDYSKPRQRIYQELTELFKENHLKQKGLNNVLLKIPYGAAQEWN